MAANVLNSRRAVQMSVFVIRAFVKMREYNVRGRRLDGLHWSPGEAAEQLGNCESITREQCRDLETPRRDRPVAADARL